MHFLSHHSKYSDEERKNVIGRFFYCREIFPRYTRNMNIPSFLEQSRDITHLSGYRTKTQAKYFFEITNEDDLQKLHTLYLFAQSEDIPLLIISWGTNLLFVQSCYPGIIIQNSLDGWRYDSDKQQLFAYSRASIWDIASDLETRYNMPLWHRFIGLPWSVWGAIYGNAWCFGLETESNFLHATVYDMESWNIQKLWKDEMQFSYRYSTLKDHTEYFLVSAEFDLSEKREKYHSDVDNIYFREHKQPKGCCCGSFFKNPSKETSAGFLIESVWLKGYHHGGAYWSDIHANFLMSDGVTCTGQDLIELVRMTQEKVRKEKWIELVNEVQIIE